MYIIAPEARIPYTIQSLVMGCTVRGSNLGRGKDIYFYKTDQTGSESHAASYSANTAFLRWG